MPNIFKLITDLIDPPSSRKIRKTFAANIFRENEWYQYLPSETTEHSLRNASIAPQQPPIKPIDITVGYYLHTDTARRPEYQHDLDAGCDLFADLQVTIEPGQSHLIPTGLSIVIPAGFEMQIRSRSGLARKHGITVLNSPGTIDAGYKGIIGVLLYNTGDKPYQVNLGDRIAQAVFAPVEHASFQFLSHQEFGASDSDRGTGGFGSTGS